ncbi:MAG: hypothetical protein IK139_02660, partial [Lachnospiraceae bacterium]|nr:hypothetical protein [Lachnospiraceae bacterium]
MSESIGYPVIKRLYECLYTDPDFFNKLSEDPLSMSEKTGIKEDPEEVLRTAERIKDTKGEENPYYVLYRERLETVNRELMEGLSESQYEDRRLYVHGRTTSSRMAVSTARIRLHPNIRYYPVMFELTEGCSQNCPFCALDTKPLSKIFLYTKENSVLWREILGIIKKAVGPAAGMGVCYFATEP